MMDGSSGVAAAVHRDVTLPAPAPGCWLLAPLQLCYPQHQHQHLLLLALHCHLCTASAQYTQHLCPEQSFWVMTQLKFLILILTQLKSTTDGSILYSAAMML